MSRTYLYVFTPNGFDVKDVTSYLDSVEGVEDWFFSIPNSIFIVGTTVTARKLSSLLRGRFGDHRHFVTLIPQKGRAGWLPKDHWNLFAPDENV